MRPREPSLRLAMETNATGFAKHAAPFWIITGPSIFPNAPPCTHHPSTRGYLLGESRETRTSWRALRVLFDARRDNDIRILRLRDVTSLLGCHGAAPSALLYAMLFTQLTEEKILWAKIGIPVLILFFRTRTRIPCNNYLKLLSRFVVRKNKRDRWLSSLLLQHSR